MKFHPSLAAAVCLLSRAKRRCLAAVQSARRADWQLWTAVKRPRFTALGRRIGPGITPTQSRHRMNPDQPGEVGADG